MNYLLYRNLLHEGFEISVLGSLGIKKDTEISTISKESIFKALEIMLLGSKADLIFMSCTNLPVLEHIQELEDKFSLPVVASNSAMFWHAMHLAGKVAACPGYGCLLSK